MSRVYRKFAIRSSDQERAADTQHPKKFPQPLPPDVAVVDTSISMSVGRADMFNDAERIDKIDAFVIIKVNVEAN